jgi:hypothetical protein
MDRWIDGEMERWREVGERGRKRTSSSSKMPSSSTAAGGGGASSLVPAAATGLTKGGND